VADLTAGARQIADKVERHPGCLQRPSGRIKNDAASIDLLLPKAWELACRRSAAKRWSKLSMRWIRKSELPGFATAAQPIADKSAPTPFGQNQKRCSQH
jgi:hypothetical protein